MDPSAHTRHEARELLNLDDANHFSLRHSMALAVFADKGAGFLPSVDVARCRQISVSFKAATSTNSLWRELYVRDFGVPSSDMQRMLHLAMHSSRRLLLSNRSSRNGTEPAGPAHVSNGGRNSAQQVASSSAVVGSGQRWSHVSAAQQLTGMYGAQPAPPPMGRSINRANLTARPIDGAPSAGGNGAAAGAAASRPAAAALGSAPSWPADAPAHAGGYTYNNVYTSPYTPYAYTQQVPRHVPARTQDRMLAQALGGSTSQHRSNPDAWRSAYRSTYLQKLHFNQLPIWLLVQRHEFKLVRRRAAESAGATVPAGAQLGLSGVETGNSMPTQLSRSTDTADGRIVDAEQEEAQRGGAAPPLEVELSTAPACTTKQKVLDACLCMATVLSTFAAVVLAARFDCLDSHPAVWVSADRGLDDSAARTTCVRLLGPHAVWFSFFAAVCVVFGIVLSMAAWESALDSNERDVYRKRAKVQIATIVLLFVSSLVQIVLLDQKSAGDLDVSWGRVFLPLWLLAGVGLFLSCYSHYRLYTSKTRTIVYVILFFGVVVPMMVIAQRLDDESDRLAELGLRSGVVAGGVISTDDPYAYPLISFWLFCGLPCAIFSAFFAADSAKSRLTSLAERIRIFLLAFVATLAFVLSCNVAAADGQVLAWEGSGSSWHEVLWPAYFLPAALAALLRAFL